MIPVFLLGRSQRPILGLPLWRFTAIAADRAGLPLLDRRPAGGEVIVVDAEAAVTPAALTALATADRRPGQPPIADRAGLIARVDAALLQGERSPGSVAELIAGQASSVVDLAIAPYRDRADRRRAEDVLMRGGTKKLLSGDFMGVLNRELTLPLVRPVARLGIHPNTVTLVGFVFTIAAAVPLALGGYRLLLLGAILQWIGSMLDGVDGKLARLKGQATVLGSRLDSRLDMVYFLALFGALAVGLARAYSVAAVAAIAAVLIAGLIAAFFIGAGMRRKLVPPDHPEQLGPLVFHTIDAHRDDPVLGFARATIRLTTRAGLPHIFLVAAVAGVLPAVFVIAAVAANLAWMIALRIERFALADQRVRHAS